VLHTDRLMVHFPTGPPVVAVTGRIGEPEAHGMHPGRGGCAGPLFGPSGGFFHCHVWVESESTWIHYDDFYEQHWTKWKTAHTYIYICYIYIYYIYIYISVIYIILCIKAYIQPAEAIFSHGVPHANRDPGPLRRGLRALLHRAVVREPRAASAGGELRWGPVGADGMGSLVNHG